MTLSIDILSLLQFSLSFYCIYSLVFEFLKILSSVTSKSIFVLSVSIFLLLTSALVVTSKSLSAFILLITSLLIK